jgi:ribosomal protein S18 acetylase RimI-like enzyme
VQYGPFRNDDPPGLLKVWNESASGRGAAFLQSTIPLETFVFAKRYFDRNGLIVARDGARVVGFVHAGFGPNGETGESGTEAGVICVLVVHPDVRGHGIGTELLRRAEHYVMAAGARSVYFGAMRPLFPFYWGIYGGSEPPGVLVSDPAAGPFLQARGYLEWDRCLVLQRPLEGPAIADPRFPGLKRQYELRGIPRPSSGRLYEEIAQAPLEILQLELQDRATGAVVALAHAWDMDLFGWRWHEPAVGIMDVEVREDLRGRGMGKLLLSLVITYLQEQFFTLAEVQTMVKNVAAIGLYEALGFRRVDEGRVYRRRDASFPGGPA